MNVSSCFVGVAAHPFTPKLKRMSDVVRIGSIIISDSTKLCKATFLILCDVIFLVRLKGKFELDHWLGSERPNPFTPKSDQCQISPAASPELLHHTIWRTWLFIAYSDERSYYTTNSHFLTYTLLLKG